MTIEAQVITDSIAPTNKRITTLQLKYPRFIHSEFMTHRVFSRNASSSRAIPVAKMIEQVRNNPAMPIHWGKNQPGMQAKEEMDSISAADARTSWRLAARDAASHAEYMMELGAHKQVANRILEPFQHIHVVVTATEWDNFFELRAHEDAQPEIHELAIQIRAAMDASTPVLLQPGEWHLPYVFGEERNTERSGLDVETLRKVSAARCCRVSYLRHDGNYSTIAEDLALCDRLIGARPLHASPFEHQATPDALEPHPYSEGATQWECPDLHGNFVGWIQHRKLIEHDFG